MHAFICNGEIDLDYCKAFIVRFIQIDWYIPNFRYRQAVDDTVEMHVYLPVTVQYNDCKQFQ